MDDLSRERYSRQTKIPGIGQEGQGRLAGKKVLIVGAGGLGTPCTSYLAGMGVGYIGLVDSDVVSLSNLPRQVMYSTADIGQEKARVLAAKLQKANPSIHIEPMVTNIHRGNIDRMITGYDVVASCVDNLDTRYILNEACVRARTPMVDAGIMGFTGIVTVVKPGQGPCYHCVFPRKDHRPNGDGMKDGSQGDPLRYDGEASSPPGVLGSAAGTAGSIQAGEVLKLLLGIGEPLVGRMLLFDLLRGDFRLISVARAPECPVCGQI